MDGPSLDLEPFWGSMSFPIQALCQLAFRNFLARYQRLRPLAGIWAMTICSAYFALQQGNLRISCAMHKIGQGA
jgi:hypothetical protein